jgi:hypothetical protein
MENINNEKKARWKYGVGMAIGIILYKLFSEFVWPLIAN